MKIYHYHSEYKTFTYEDFAETSPLDPPGVWLVPAYATDIEPPEYAEGFIPLFTNNSWEIIEDKRGIYYHTNTFQEFYNYNPLVAPDYSTKEKPPEVIEGKVLKWYNEWVLEDIPKLPDLENLTEVEDLTPQEKLEKLGLTVEDLKQLLNINI